MPKQNEIEIPTEFRQLPFDVKTEILKHLKVRDKARLARVSKAMHKLVANSKLESQSFKGSYQDLQKIHNGVKKIEEKIQSLSTAIKRKSRLEDSIINDPNESLIEVASSLGGSIGGLCLIALGALIEQNRLSLMIPGIVLNIAGSYNLFATGADDERLPSATTLVARAISFFRMKQEDELKLLQSEVQDQKSILREFGV